VETRKGTKKKARNAENLNCDQAGKYPIVFEAKNVKEKRQNRCLRKSGISESGSGRQRLRTVKELGQEGINGKCPKNPFKQDAIQVLASRDACGEGRKRRRGAKQKSQYCGHSSVRILTP